MALAHSPSIVTNGLKVCFDAANPKSYPGSGTTWYDLSPSGISATLYNGAVLNRDKGGVIAFDGTDDYAQTADVNLGPSGSISIFVTTLVNAQTHNQPS